MAAYRFWSIVIHGHGAWMLSQVEAKITARTRAIMPVHIYGHPVDMDPILDLAERHGLAVIEDAAEVHGAEYLSGRDTAHPAWRRCGSFGMLSCFSFYANKLITTGEGGMVLTDDAKLAEKARSLRNLCFQANRRFHHEELGFNFRLTNLQAALGVAQLERIEEIINRKRWMGQEYNSSPRRHKKFAAAGGRTVGSKCLLDVRRCPLRRSRHGRACFCTEAKATGNRDPTVFSRIT